MALPLGELSPQVTERVLQSFLNDNINLFTHITEISVDITVGESQNLLGCYPLGMVIVCPLRPRCARPPLPRGEARNARAVHQRERQDVFPGTSPLRALAALGHLSQGERQGMPARYTKGRGKMFSRVRLHFGHSLRSATSPKGRGKMFSRVRLPFGHSLRSATSPKGRGKGCPRGTPKGVQKRALCRFGKSDIIRPIPHPGTM